MAEKLKVLYNGKISNDVNLVSNPHNKTTFISKITIRELGNASMYRFLINGEPISEFQKVEYGELVNIDANTLLAPGEVFSIDLDNGETDLEFNKGIEEALKDKVSSLELGEINVLFIRYGIICFKAGSVYYFYNYDLEKQMVANKVEVLVDLGRSAYFFKADNVVYAIIDGKLESISAHSNLQYVCKEKFVIYDDVDSKIKIYNSKAQKVTEEYNGKILGYSRVRDYMIIRLSPFEQDAIPDGPTDRSKDCICYHYDLLTGEMTKIFTLEDIEVTSKPHVQDRGWRWKTMTARVEDRYSIIATVYKSPANATYYYTQGAYALFVFVYDSVEKRIKQKFTHINKGQMFIDGDWLMLSSLCNSPTSNDKTLYRELYYNFKTDELIEPDRTNRNWVPTVFNGRVYLHNVGSSKVAVINSIEEYARIDISRIAWSNTTIYTSNSYKTSIGGIMSNNTMILKSSIYSNSIGYYYKNTDALPTAPAVDTTNILPYINAMNSNMTVGGVWYNGQLAIGLSYADTDCAKLSIRNTTDPNILKQATLAADNDVQVPNVFAATTIPEAYAHSLNKADITNNATGKYYNPICIGNNGSYPWYHTIYSLGNLMITNDYNTDNMVALIMKIGVPFSYPGVLRVTYPPGVQNNPDTVEYESITNIEYIYGLEGNPSDGYTLYTTTGVWRLATPSISDISKVDKKFMAKYVVNARELDKINVKELTKVNEKLLTNTDKDGNKLYVRVTGVEIDE